MRNATAVGDLRPRHVSTASRGVRNTVCPPPRAMNATRGLLWPRLASKLQGRLRKGWNAALWSAGDARKRETGSPKRRSEEHTSELQSRYVISYAVFCL